MKKALFLLAAATLILGACSTSNQVAQQTKHNDDVYYSDITAVSLDDIAKAERISPRKQREEMYYDDETTYNDYGYYGYNRYNTYRAPWRNSYYNPYRIDPWFDYYGYGYGYNFNNWYTPGISLYIGSNPWYYRNIYSYNYGFPYYGSYYGGNVLYNSYYPGYNYGNYYGGNVIYPPAVVNPNYRARPSLRGTENISGTVPGLQTVRRDANGRVITTPSRGDIYQRNNPGRTSPAPARTSSTTPTPRPARTQQADPQRNNQPTYNQPDRASGSSSSGNNNGGGGGNSGGGSADRARPSRAGN